MEKTKEKKNEELFKSILMQVYKTKTVKEQEIISDYFLEVAVFVKGFSEVANIIDGLRVKKPKKAKASALRKKTYKGKK